MDEKFNNKGVLPTYDKNAELTMEQTLMKLKGEAGSFKKDVEVVPQKPQPVPFSPVAATIPPEFLKKHLEDLTKAPSEQAIKSGTINPSMNCKFLSSPKCHPNYPNFSGASINVPEGSKMKCDSLGNEQMAKAVCTISAGKITGVYIIEEGEGIGMDPKVEAIGGGGEGAKFKAVVEGGKVKEVKILNGGKGFHETPIIKIEGPNLSSGCYLCCK
jgi:hypothetical protein